MLKQVQRDVPVAKHKKPIDIDPGYERLMDRFPRIMACLGR